MSFMQAPDKLWSDFSKPTKVARRFLEDGTKVRVSKRTGHIIPKPAYERIMPRSIRKSCLQLHIDAYLIVWLVQ